jgi:hypothetical protein
LETQEHRTVKAILSGSFAEGIIGLIAAGLAIAGLAGVEPTLMLYIATIAIGAALLFEGGTVGMQYSSLISQGGRTPLDATEIGSGMTAEFVGGAAGIALGVLALMNVYPVILTASAAIVYGVVLILGSGIIVRLNAIASQTEVRPEEHSAAHGMLVTAANFQLLIGLAVVALGILAIVGYSPFTLTLTAMLIVGVADLIRGTAIGSRIRQIFRR